MFKNDTRRIHDPDPTHTDFMYTEKDPGKVYSIDPCPSPSRCLNSIIPIKILQEEKNCDLHFEFFLFYQLMLS